MVAPTGAVFVCGLSLLKFTLVERDENRPPEALSNSFGRPRIASRGRRDFSALCCSSTAGVSLAFCLKRDESVY